MAFFWQKLIATYYFDNDKVVVRDCRKAQASQDFKVEITFQYQS